LQAIQPLASRRVSHDPGEVGGKAPARQRLAQCVRLFLRHDQVVVGHRAQFAHQRPARMQGAALEQHRRDAVLRLQRCQQARQGVPAAGVDRGQLHAADQGGAVARDAQVLAEVGVHPGQSAAVEDGCIRLQRQMRGIAGAQGEIAGTRQAADRIVRRITWCSGALRQAT
jgi:hypothetical protein